MACVSLVFELDARDADALSDLLIEAGALSVSSEDAASGTEAELPIFDEPGENAPGWLRHRLRVLARDEASGREMLARACLARGLRQTFAVQVERVDELDWVRETRAQFAPIRVSSRLWIVPSWRRAPDPQAVNLVLDPGRAFGTGSHPSTRLCLQWLEREVRGGETVLDYGCGSGILAIAALKLGAQRALGVDIDAQAIEAARANAAANGVACDFVHAGAPLGIKADLVVANILANPLRLLAPAIAALTRAGGKLALAGILAPQADEVAQAYRPWFAIDPLELAEGWALVAATRLGKP